MKQKKYINILIVVLSSLALLILWFSGLDYIYAQLLRLGANLVLLIQGDTHVGLKMIDGAPTFIVETMVQGKKGTYPQKADLILMPFIMILTWQVLLFFNLPKKQATRSAWQNLLMYFIIQVIYVILLTAYYDSKSVKFVYDLLMDSFYIIALFLIVKDAFRFDLFKSATKS